MMEEIPEEMKESRVEEGCKSITSCLFAKVLYLFLLLDFYFFIINFLKVVDGVIKLFLYFIYYISIFCQITSGKR